MVLNKIKYLLIATTVLFFAACGGDGADGTGQEDAATLQLSAQSVDLTPSPGSFMDISYTSNHPVVKAEVKIDDVSWCKVIVSKEKVRFQAATINSGYTPRTTQVTIIAGYGDNTTTKSVSVSQQGVEAPLPTLVLSESTGSVDNELNASKEVSVTSNGTVSASVSTADAAWCALSYDAASTKLTITATTLNTHTASRTAIVTVKASSEFAFLEKEYSFTQAGTATAPEVSLYDAVGSGIVFWISEDRMQYKVVSLTEASGATSKWCSARGPKIDATNDLDGVANVAVMKARPNFTTEFPAANFCDGMAGGGWYLPAKAELLALHAATFIYSQTTPTTYTPNEAMSTAITNAGGVAIQVGGQTYWSSTEHNETNAIALRFNDRLVNNFAKDGAARFVRCIKKAER